MKFALVLAALIGVLGFTHAEASAASLDCHGQLTQGGHVCIVGNTLIGSPIGWHWIRDVATGKTYLFPDGDDTDAFISGFYRNQNSALVVAFDPNSTVSLTGFTFDGSGNANVNVQVFSATVKTNPVPSLQTFGTNTVLISQFDFAVNQATCTSVSAPASYSGAVPNTGHFCWIVKATAGTLFRLTWDSLSNMNTLVAGTNVQCFDNATTNSGAIVYQGSWGAGQIIDFGDYGRPFVNGLTCIANHAVGVAANDSMEAWVK